MEMRGEGLLRQKEQHGKRCVNKKGEVGDPSTVAHWRGTVGNKTPQEKREHLACLALLGEPLNIFLNEKIMQSKKDWTKRNGMSPLENRG